MGAINTIADLQKVFGDMPLSSVQPILTLKPKLPTGKTILTTGVIIFSVIGLFGVFSKVKDMIDGESDGNSKLDKMKEFRKNEMEKQQNNQV